MSAGMPELGSKISLISKADIRYEGRLFTVDPQECTIALANVKSFGTEDRETQFPVAPQNQVYEYILFRGSDIKDIRVVNSVSSLPNDPAIVQMTVQPMGQQSYQPQPGFGHPMMGQMGGMGGQFGPPYGMGGMGAMGPMMGMGGAPSRPAMNKQPSVLDMISGGSRSTTPTSLLTRKSPTMDQGVQVNQQANNVGKIGDKQIRNAQGPHRDRDGGRASGMSQYSEGKQQQQQQQQQQHHQQRDGQMHGGQNMRNRGPGGGGGGGWMNNQRGAPNQLVRGRGGPPGGPRGGRGGNFRNQQPGQGGNKAKNTLKFDNDYDFEQANTEFEELRSKLAKTKIEGTATGPESEKKDDSGNETGAGDNEPEEEQPEIVHYDKAKSFFDNISCEAVERSKGRSQRTDWRTERKLNSETFGVASMRRGNFRGRGYYNNRGGNMGGGNMMYHRNNQQGNQNYNRGGGYRGPRGGGGQRRPNQQQQQQQNSQTGSSGGPSNQSNRTASTNEQPSNSTASTNATNANAATSSSTSSTSQSATRLVTGTA